MPARYVQITYPMVFGRLYKHTLRPGFCYPGTGKSGDLPPRPECEPAWRSRILAALPNVGLTLVVGQYGQAYHMKGDYPTLTETVRAWKSYGLSVVPLPHPSPRNNIWLKRNPWFEKELIPTLRNQVATVLAE